MTRSGVQSSPAAPFFATTKRHELRDGRGAGADKTLAGCAASFLSVGKIGLLQSELGTSDAYSPGNCAPRWCSGPACHAGPAKDWITGCFLHISSDSNLATAKAKEWRVYQATASADAAFFYRLVFAPLIAPLEALKLALQRSLGGSS